MNCFLRLYILFLWLWRTKTQDSTDPLETMNIYRDYLPDPIDFRCYDYALSTFEFTDISYIPLDYVVSPGRDVPVEHCNAFENPYLHYPKLTALDPMLPFYIHTIHKGLAVIAETTILYDMSPKVVRRLRYCLDIRVIASTFGEYFERFDSDDETCRKLKEIVLECYNFRQLRKFWVENVYEKLCLDEDGCFNVMEYYGDDLPYCVKYIATEELKNASFGSWHHSFINYCELTDLIPQAKYANYDGLIVRESGRTDEQMKLMCEYFRFHLLTEEGKEGEIQEVKTEKGDSSLCAGYYWDQLYIAVIITMYSW